jgi:fumarate reductase subunit D
VLGVTLVIIGLLMPLGVYPVAQTAWPAVWKTAVGGILFFGFEITAVPAAAIMGKDNFERIVGLARSWIGRLKPSGEVGKLRHAVGLVLLLLPNVPTYIMAYAPAWLPDNSPERLWVNLGADAMFLTSLFVLGGDFWDKLRALFVREARAVFPVR